MPQFKRMLAALICIVALLMQSPSYGQQGSALDPLGEPIDNAKFYRHFERAAMKLMQQDVGTVTGILQSFNDAPTSCSLDVGEFKAVLPNDRSETYQHLVKSTVLLGELYDCGRCDKTHVRFAGGVLISSDGLMLTNHHVFGKMDASRTKASYAMTWDGKLWPIEEVLFADEASDSALIRLKGDGHKFHAAPLAHSIPAPMERVRVMSHPSGEFYVMTHGEVSRYVSSTRNRTTGQSQNSKEHWMEITAAFGAGSSGSGVFNEKGEVVGLVSRIHPLMRRPTSKSTDGKVPKTSFVEMVLRRCVPLASIRDGFEPTSRTKPVSLP